jgi:hypothetical protein
MVWRATGSGPLSLVATSNAMRRPLRPNQLTHHESSTWNRPGDEWGTLWRFPSTGCYKITATRSGQSASIDVTVREAARLPCQDVIGAPEHPDPGYTIVLGRVALPTGYALQAAPSGEDDSNTRLFAKQGLLVKPGSTFELIVPDEWKGRLTIGWGSPAQRTARLEVRGCQSKSSMATQWLAYAGGYWVRDPACVALIVKAAHKMQRVRIGVGEACPGQDPAHQSLPP